MLLGDRVLSWRIGDILPVVVGAGAQGRGVNDGQVSRVNRREGIASLLYSRTYAPPRHPAAHSPR